jgi:hypothetical protein
MTDQIEFRNQTDAPTEPGWYYAIEEGYEIPTPTWVLRTDPNKPLEGQGHRGWRDVCFFRWFGKVAQVRPG